MHCIFILCILSQIRLIKKVGRDVMDRDFVLFILPVVLFFNCLWVYFIVRSGTGPWARGRSFRLLRGPTVSRAVGDFE